MAIAAVLVIAVMLVIAGWRSSDRGSASNRGGAGMSDRSGPDRD